MTVYVMVAPWDSYTVGALSVYKTRAAAEKAKKEYDDNRSVYASDAVVYEEILQ